MNMCLLNYFFNVYFFIKLQVSQGLASKSLYIMFIVLYSVARTEKKTNKYLLGE